MSPAGEADLCHVGWSQSASGNPSRHVPLLRCPHPSDEHRHRFDRWARWSTCRSCWGMITIRSGSTPRRHRPRSAASSAVIAQAGSSCSKLFTTTSGHRRRSTSCTSRRSIPSCVISHQCHVITACHASEADITPSLLRRAIRSRTSRNPRRSRRTASGRPADKCSGMTARLQVVASADHWHMPFHHARIIGRRHHTHAADRQMCGQPLPLCRPNVLSCSLRDVPQIEITDRTQGCDDLFLAAYALAICRSVVMPYLCGADF